jgi:hypothetical protein
MKSLTKSKDFLCKTIFPFGFLVLIIFLLACNNDNTEQKEYDSLKTNLKFKSYKTLSENTIPPLVLLYNSTSHKDDPEISEGVLRLLLGYSWIVNNKPNYAIAEGSIIQDLSTDDKDLKFLAHSLLAISMYEEGWKKLAAEEAEKGESLLNKEPRTTDSQLKTMTFHIIMGTLSVYEENFQGARFHFAGLSITTGISWPYQIADAMADLKEGKNKQGLLKIKVLKSEKDIPEAVKKTLTETLAKIEKTSGTIDSKLFWPRSISLALYSEIRNSEINGIDKVTELLDNLSEKLKID